MQRGADGNQQWTHDLNQDTLGGGGGGGGGTDVDFAKFLELGNDFSQFDNLEQQSSSGLDTPMGRLTFAQDGQLQALTPQHAAMLQSMDLDIGNISPQLAYPHMEHQQLGQNQQFQQYPVYQEAQIPYQQRVPPTPVSNEMQAAKYAVMDPTSQIIFERQHASFTPLLSPAQTPVENPWNMPDYVLADDFFSPLTSPAIEAQPHYASTNATSSPADLPSEQCPTAKKSRRKLNPTSRVASARNLRSLPSGKAVTRRRQASVGGTSKDGPSSEGGQHLLPGRTSTAVSSEESVSPEAMTESLMRPPPVPQVRTPNTLRSQSRDSNAPATPATLMKIAGKRAEVVSSSSPTSRSPEVMEDITLPAAATEMTSRTLSELESQIVQDDDQSTPTLSAKTPKLSADSTPRSTGARAAGNAPESFMKPTRGGRTSKKRQSISQAAVSPALRPKISPSISPLAPSTSEPFAPRVPSRPRANRVYRSGDSNTVARDQCSLPRLKIELSEHHRWYSLTGRFLSRNLGRKPEFQANIT